MASIKVRALPNLDAEAIRDTLLSLPDGDRKMIISRPSSGQKEVVAIQQGNDGKIVCECIDIPVS